MSDELPPGLYEQVVTAELNRLLQQLPEALHEIKGIDPGEAHEVLARHLHGLLRLALHGVKGEDKDKLAAQVALCNEILETIGRHDPDLSLGAANVASPGAALMAIHRDTLGARPQRPIVPLHASALLVNDGERLSVGAAIKREIESADAIDLICAFVNHTGVRILEPEIRAVVARGGSLRLITTTYLGATQRKALDLLAGWGAQIKITYELPPANTKLHAKAWLFHRNSGFHTAVIGSSNLSHTALMDGLEWNVRLSNVDAGQIIARFRSTFDRYWADPAFEEYDPARDALRLDRALNVAGPIDNNQLVELFLDIEPRPHQSEILEALEVARERHGQWRNLVVAATGTGKTIIAALDYKRLKQQRGDLSLLFVAHRKEILDQSRAAFRMVLRDGAFGERWVDGDRPVDYRHVFASIQSLSSFDLTRIKPDHFDVVIVDEFHHAEAATYRKLLDYVQPMLLLGLTATPERTDGKNVMDFFGGASTTEMRLWDALDAGLLCPFQYFGINDETNLQDLRWERGAYDVGDLETRYVAQGDQRAALVFEQVRRIVTDWRTMRALGFCVSVAHARYMQRKFQQYGVPCAAVDADTPADERRRVVRELREGRLNVIFAVDLFNEGVDIPEVDTVLFLRPTESATVFLQQLGRGLRLCEGKSCLTVLDFIGLQHQKFRFELRYRALTGISRMELQRQVEQGFPALPAGCYIQLDRVARKTVLDNLKHSLPLTARQMTEELRRLGHRKPDLTLTEYLADTGLAVEDLYRPNRYFTSLKRAAGLLAGEGSPLEKRMGGALERMLHVDDAPRVEFYRKLLARSTPPEVARLLPAQQAMIYMLAYGLLRDFERLDLQSAIDRLWPEEALRAELIDLLEVLDTRSETLAHPLEAPGLEQVPIQTHATYSKDEVMAAFSRPNPASMREGVAWFEQQKCDTLFVTLRKTEQDYSPTTRYNDYPVSPLEFHWESQSTTSAASRTGQRYVHHARQGSQVLLFARASKVRDGRTSPYLCLGPVEYVSHESERPMRILWRLQRPMPTVVFQDFKAAAG